MKRKRKGEKELEPMYTAEEALRCLEIFEPVKYDEIIEITPEIQVRFNDAGHMLGSSIIELWVTEDGKKTKTVFTGDLGNNEHEKTTTRSRTRSMGTRPSLAIACIRRGAPVKL